MRIASNPCDQDQVKTYVTNDDIDTSYKSTLAAHITMIYRCFERKVKAKVVASWVSNVSKLTGQLGHLSRDKRSEKYL